MSYPLTPLSRSASITSVPCPRVMFDTGSISLTAGSYAGEYTWTIRQFSNIKERKVLSGEFEIGHYSWRLLLFPKGNDNREKTKTSGVAMYLSFNHALFTPEFLNPKVKFQITAVNQKFPQRSISIDAQHTFSKRSPDWGFTNLLLQEELQDAEYGFLVKDTLIFKAELIVVPRHMLRNETGFLGLSFREDAPGLNAVLQALFYVPYFRKAVYNIDIVETVATGKRLSHALRRLFFKLQYQDSTASTKEVMQILGHCEVRERFSSTIEKLLLEFVGSNAETVISNLFEGCLCTYVENEVEKETKKIESNYKQIDLNVTGCLNLYEAIDKRCRVTTAAEMKNAIQYSLFEKLPTILYIQLHQSPSGSDSKHHVQSKGAQMDTRIADDLNMDYGGKRFFGPSLAGSELKNTYKLHAVFVQQLHGRGDFVYIKRQDGWFKFENIFVQQVDETEVFGPHERFDKFMVYALLYIRNSNRLQITWEAGRDDIVQSIRKDLERSLSEKELHMAERQTANMYVVINVATERDFTTTGSVSSPMKLVDFDYIKSYRLTRDTSYEEFRKLVSADFKVSTSAQRYWSWRRGDHGELTLDKIFPSLAQDNKKLLNLHSIRDPTRSADKRNNALMVINLFLELPKPGESMLHEIQSGEILLFLKFYDPFKVVLDFVGSFYVQKKALFGGALEKAKKLLDVQKDLDISAARVVTMEPSAVTCEIFAQSTPHQNGLSSGDIVIVQPKMVPLLTYLKQGNKRQSTFDNDSTLGKV